MNVEYINTDWFNSDALRLPDYRVGRVNFGRGRSYIRINSDGSLEDPLRLYTSLTTAINTCAPMEHPLLEWYCKHGTKEAGRLLEIAQHYGTLLHLEIGKFLIEGVYDFDSCSAAVESYTDQHSFWQPECKEWNHKIKHDMAAFIQFSFDYKIKPLGIEYVLLSEKGFGTLIDLVCDLTIQVPGQSDTEVYKSGPRKGQPKDCEVDKQVRAIINFKSGRHGFYRSNGIQIECERQLWEENFPDLPVEMACNWSPKEWRDNPSYNFKDWTGDVVQDEVDAILKLAEVRYASKAENKTYLNINGVVSTQESLTDALGKESIQGYCNRKFGSTPAEDPKQMEKINRVYTSKPLPI